MTALIVPGAVLVVLGIALVARGNSVREAYKRDDRDNWFPWLGCLGLLAGIAMLVAAWVVDGVAHSLPNP